MSVSLANVVSAVSLKKTLAREPGKPDKPKSCGMTRFGRLNGSHTMFYKPRCGTRRCQVCLPIVVNKKMARVGPSLYGKLIERSSFGATLRSQLRGSLDRDGVGDYFRIPVSRTEVLIVSDAEIGYPIDREVVHQKMLDALPEWGSISSSKGWRAFPTYKLDNGFVDEGVCTSSPEWITGYAEKRMKLTPIEGEHATAYQTSTAEHLLLKAAAGVKSDEDYWQDVKAFSSAWPKHFISDFLARCA